MPQHTGVFMVARVYDRATARVMDLAPAFGMVLTSMEIEIGLGMHHKISVSLEMPYQQGLTIVESTLFDISNVLMVKFGYSQTGYESPWVAGVMRDPSVSIGDTWSVTLQAEGGGALAMARSASKGWSGTRQSIIEQVSERFGWGLDIDVVEDRLLEEVSIQQSGETYFLFVSALIHDAGYNFWIGTNADGKATLFMRSRVNATQPTRSFVKFGGIDRSKNQYPLLGYSTQNSAYQTTGAATLTAVWMDEDGNIVRYDANEGASALPHTGEGSSAGGVSDENHAQTGLQLDMRLGDGESSDVVGVAPLGVSPSQMGKAVQSRHDEIMSLSGRKATIETIGIPNMLPGELVTIYGCTKRYDGNYGVLSVKHTIGDNGFMTSFDGCRDAFARSYGFGDDLFPTETAPAQGTD